jgi:hypothetical protein
VHPVEIVQYPLSLRVRQSFDGGLEADYQFGGGRIPIQAFRKSHIPSFQNTLQGPTAEYEAESAAG